MGIETTSSIIGYYSSCMQSQSSTFYVTIYRLEGSSNHGSKKLTSSSWTQTAIFLGDMQSTLNRESQNPTVRRRMLDHNAVTCVRDHLNMNLVE